MKTQVVFHMVLITLFCVGASALAQPPPPMDTARRAELVRKFDLDGDGRLSNEEMEKARTEAAGFGRAKERAGRRESKTEGPVRNDAQMQKLLELFDKDGNGKLSFSEMEVLRGVERQRRAAAQERGVFGTRTGKPEPDRP